MGQKTQETIDCLLIDPEKAYKTPESVLADNRLTQEQKDKILHCWEQDQLALIRAEEENMTRKTDSPLPVEMLEKIKQAEKKLEAAGDKGESA